MLVGFCALGALLGAVDLLLKLILLCFTFCSIDLLKLILNSRSWEGMGRKGGSSGQGWGAPPSLLPSTSLRHSPPDQ